MENKSFFITAIVVIAVVSILTSMVGVMLFRPVLMAPVGTEEEGLVEIAGGISGEVDVILIDENVVAGILDRVTFTSISRGDTSYTDLVDDFISDPDYPSPFVIRNEGNVKADVNLVQYRDPILNTEGLFDHADSRLKYWMGEFDYTIMDYPPEFSGLDDCMMSGPCVTSFPGCTSQPNPTDATCQIPIKGLAPSIQIINGLGYSDEKDEAIMQILIYVSPNEDSGSKDTWIEIIGNPDV